VVLLFDVRVASQNVGSGVGAAAAEAWSFSFEPQPQTRAANTAMAISFAKFSYSSLRKAPRAPAGRPALSGVLVRDRFG